MKPILSVVAALATALTMSACTTSERGVGAGILAGGLLGGAIGGAVAGTWAGAAVGATLVGVAGAAVGSSLVGRYAANPGQCVYEDQSGRRFLAPCS